MKIEKNECIVNSCICALPNVAVKPLALAMGI